MIKKQISAMLVCLLLATFAALVTPAQTDDGYTKVRTEAVRYENKKKLVKVKMRQGFTQKGYVGRVGAESFDFTDSQSSKVSTLFYKDVSSIKKNGGLSKSTIITLATIGAAAVIFGAIFGRYLSQ